MATWKHGLPCPPTSLQELFLRKVLRHVLIFKGRTVSLQVMETLEDFRILLELRLPDKLPQATRSCGCLSYTMPVNHSSGTFDNLFSTLFIKPGGLTPNPFTHLN